MKIATNQKETIFSLLEDEFLGREIILKDYAKQTYGVCKL
jgi:hypothetical protein